MLTIYTYLTDEQQNELKTFCRLMGLASKAGVKRTEAFIIEDIAHNHTRIMNNCWNPHNIGGSGIGLLTKQGIRNILVNLDCKTCTPKGLEPCMGCAGADYPKSETEL